MRMRDFDIVFSGLSLGEHQFLYNLNDTFFTLYDYTEHSKLKATAEVTLHKHNTFLDCQAPVLLELNPRPLIQKQSVLLTTTEM